MLLSPYGQLVKNGIINQDIEEIVSSWPGITDCDRDKISTFLSKINKKDKEDLCKKISIINEYIGKDFKQLMTQNIDEEVEQDDESSDEEENKDDDNEYVDEDTFLYIMEQKAKMLGEFSKSLINNGIKDKETIRLLLVEELRTGINK